MGSLTIEPSLLPYYLTAEEVARFWRVSTYTIAEWCKSGKWEKGKHWVWCGRRRRFLRDAIFALVEEKQQATALPKRFPVCRGNLSESPELAAIIERERRYGNPE